MLYTARMSNTSTLEADSHLKENISHIHYKVQSKDYYKKTKVPSKN